MKTLVSLSFLIFSLSSFAQSLNMNCASAKGDLINVTGLSEQNVLEVKVNNKRTNLANYNDFAQGKIFVMKDGYSVFEWQTYLEKNSKGNWSLNRYWFCNSYYFEEKCATDELVLEESTLLKCNL
jgi:hypothetical protein